MRGGRLRRHRIGRRGARARAAASRRWPARRWPAGVSRREPEQRPGARRPSAPTSPCSTTASRPRSCGILREAGARVTVFPWDCDGGRGARAEPRRRLLGNGPGDPAALPGCVAEVRDLVGARAAVRDLPRPPAARPGARPGDVQAPVRPPRRQPPGARASTPGACWSRPRTTASRCAAPDAGRRLRDRLRPRPGHARLALRRHRRGPRAARPAGLRRCSSTPRPAPARTTPATTLTRFVGGARAGGPRAVAPARRHLERSP